MSDMDSTGAAVESAIPIVDFAKWSPDASFEQKKEIADQLTEACKKVGFVYIVHHPVAPERLAEAFAWSQKLFNLRREEKMLAPHPNGPAVHRGYSWPGLEKVSNLMGDEDDADMAKKERQITDVKESYEIGSESNTDQPNVWLPEHVLPGFREFTTEFYWECHEAAKMILRAMAIGIGLPDEEYFLASHSGHNNQLRLLHYPPVPAADLENHSVARMPAHSDWGSITLVFQDDCGGLEVENPHQPGDFIAAPPLKDAIIMNVGDLMQRWSNDILKSTLHRVSKPPLASRIVGPARITRARYSIPYFVSPVGSSVVACLPGCTDGAHPVRYAPILWDTYRLMRAGAHYEDSSREEMVAG